MTRSPSKAIWAFAITSLALFMVALDNLVVTTALPVIKRDLGASLQDLQWMVNAYTLTFAVLLDHRRRARRPIRPQARLPHRDGAPSSADRRWPLSRRRPTS